MTLANMGVLSLVNPSVLAKGIIDAMPNTTQVILGREDGGILNFSQLPAVEDIPTDDIYFG